MSALWDTGSEPTIPIVGWFSNNEAHLLTLGASWSLFTIPCCQEVPVAAKDLELTSEWGRQPCRGDTTRWDHWCKICPWEWYGYRYCASRLIQWLTINGTKLFVMSLSWHLLTAGSRGDGQYWMIMNDFMNDHEWSSTQLVILSNRGQGAVVLWPRRILPIWIGSN